MKFSDRLIGILTFIYLYIAAAMPLAFMGIWRLLAGAIRHVFALTRAEASAESSKTIGAHRFTSTAAILANYILSVVLTAALAGAWCFHTDHSATWTDPAVVQCFNIGLGIAVAPAILMGLKRILFILLIVMRPLGRMCSEAAAALRWWRDRLAQAVDHLLGIRPKS